MGIILQIGISSQVLAFHILKFALAVTSGTFEDAIPKAVMAFEMAVPVYALLDSLGGASSLKGNAPHLQEGRKNWLE
jgi:hypothetical protein